MGGAEYQVKCIINELKKSGKFIIYYITKHADSEYKPNGYKIIKIPGHSCLIRYGYFYDAINLSCLLKKIGPDIIYQRVGGAYTGITAYHAVRYNIKMVWHIAHDTDVMPFQERLTIKSSIRYIDKKLLDYGVRNAHQIIAQSHQQADFLTQYFNRKPIKIIRNFHPMPQEKIEKPLPVKILWVANIKPMKQPEIFIKLAKDLDRLSQPVECIMIGRPFESNLRWQNQLEQEIDKISILSYLGNQSIEKVNQLLDSAHIFVNTSIYEGFPNTFIQAWMRRVPVVSLNCNPDSILTQKRIGLVSNNYDGLLSDVISLVAENSIRDRMGESAQRYAFKTFSLKNIHSLLRIL